MNFEKILNLKITHDYYNGSRAPGLFFCAPLEQSQSALRNLRMRLKQTEDGFFVFAQTDQTDPPGYYITPPENTFLSFGLYSNNTQLLNFTDMPYINPGDEIFYRRLDPENPSIQLTQEKLYPLELKGILTNSKAFSVKMHEPALKRYQKEAEPGGAGNRLFPDPNLYYIDLTAWPEGLYEIKSDDKNFAGKKVFARRDLIARPPLVILTYVLPKELEQSALTDASFELRLNSRKLYWRYEFENISGDRSRYSVNTAQAEFTGRQSGVKRPDFPEIDTNHTVTSKNETLLTESPWTKIELLKSSPSGEQQALIENLPNPGVNKIYRERNGETTSFYALIEVKL